MVSGKELVPVALILDQIRQVLDALAHSVILDDGVKATGLFDRLNHAEWSLSLSIAKDEWMAIPCIPQ